MGREGERERERASPARTAQASFSKGPVRRGRQKFGAPFTAAISEALACVRAHAAGLLRAFVSETGAVFEDAIAVPIASRVRRALADAH